MGKGSVQGDITIIESDVDRPKDRQRKKDKVRTDESSQSVSGSGGSGTIITNNSEAKWYLENVTFYALGASVGTLAIEVWVEDDSGNVRNRLGTDVTTGFLDFDGDMVKPGWAVKYSVSQNDTNSYTVEKFAHIRKPEPKPEGSTVDTDTTTSDTVDDFEDGDIAEYSGDTTQFSTTTNDSYSGNNSLEQSADGSNYTITSSSGLDNYPTEGDKFRWFAKASIGRNGGNKAKPKVQFLRADANNHYELQMNFTDGKFFLEKMESGAETTIAESNTFDTQASKWYQFDITIGSSTIDVEVIDPDTGNVKLSESATNDLSTTGTDIAWEGEADNGETLRWDNAQIV